MFWELYRLDAWIVRGSQPDVARLADDAPCAICHTQSFATGRAPAINLADTDTKFAEFEGDASLMPCTPPFFPVAAGG